MKSQSTSNAVRVIPGSELETGGVAPLFPPARLLSRERMEAREILEQAKASAAALLETARVEIEAAKREGFEAGRAEGSAQAAELIQHIEREAGQIRQSVAVEVQQWALRFARLLIDAELAVRPERLLHLVGQALSTARHMGEVTLRLHPEDAELIRRHQGATLALVSAETRLNIVDDATMGRHGVKVETGRGVSSISVDDFFKKLGESILDNADNALLDTVAPPVAGQGSPLEIWQEDVASSWASRVEKEDRP